MAMADRQNLSRDYARLMLVMRRMVREEFSTTIHLDAPGAGEELLSFARLSENPMLKEMAVELEGMLGVSEQEAAPTDENESFTDSVTYYRGAPVKTAVEKVPDRGSPEGPTRIYRGQKLRT